MPLGGRETSFMMNLFRKYKTSIYAVAILTLLNVFAHFLPFERISLAPDDYIHVANVQDKSLSELFHLAWLSVDRPLNLLFINFQHKFIGLNTHMSLWLILITSTFLNLIIYFLMVQLVQHEWLALLCSVFYLLMPNKLDLFHTPIYVNINVVFALYILSFLLFISFVKRQKKIFMGFSILTYMLAIFWYEVGFCLPVILFFYAYLYDRNKLKFVFLFLIPMVFYVTYRFTGAFGLVESGASHYVRSFSTILYNFFIMAPNHYIGRYIIRAILYALYRFPSIEMPWLSIIIIGDFIVLYFFFNLLSKIENIKFDKRLIGLSFAVMIFFLLPNSLYIIESRHTALASIGFVCLFISFCYFIKINRRIVLSVVFLIFLIVSQGTAWNQVVACRIQNAVFQTIRESKDAILKADRVIIDQYSYAAHIPYTWGERSINMLDCYWGMQAFAPWGLSGMLNLTTGVSKTHYISRSPIKRVDEKLIFQDYSLPIQGTLVIDYNTTYGKEGARYKNGNRIN